MYVCILPIPIVYSRSALLSPLWHFSCYSLQHRIMSQRSALPKEVARLAFFFRKCSAGSTGWPVLSTQIASEQRGVRELGLPEKNKVLSPINHSLCSRRCLPNEVEIIGGCCRCPYFTDTEHCLFKGLKWSDSTHLSDFFISKPEHQWPRGHSQPRWQKAFIQTHESFSLDSLNQAVSGRLIQKSPVSHKLLKKVLCKFSAEYVFKTSFLAYLVVDSLFGFWWHQLVFPE